MVKNLPANAGDRRCRFDPWIGNVGDWACIQCKSLPLLNPTNTVSVCCEHTGTRGLGTALSNGVKVVFTMCACVFSCSVVSDSVTPWTVAFRALLSMEFSRQEYWSKLPFPTPDTECRYRLLVTNSSFNYDILQVLQQIWISQVSPAVNMTFHSFCSPVFSFSVYIFLPIGFAFNLLQKGLNCMESWDSSHLKCRWT